MATIFRSGFPSKDPLFDSRHGLSWIIERAGRAVGYLVLALPDSDDRATKRAYIAGLFVEPEERGKGLGPLAQRFAADVGRTLGFKIYATGLGGEDKEARRVAVR